ncbi:mas-related G-protein coupled receptor member X2-like isoform X2 [Channa argus]|uniref:mas-related G-protein coupled receptor member X2-like isoform X2 n=1 Tax=Channa argus TaxID=215402 RepID=UPI003521BBC5
MALSSFNNTSTQCNGSNTVYNKEIRHVVTCVIISFGLPLTLVAIYAVYSLFCCMIIRETGAVRSTVGLVYIFGLMASVGFMVCIALERYLVIAWPLWYRRRRTIRISLVVCVVVWTLSLIYLLLAVFWVGFKSFRHTFLGIFLLLPFPFLIFFLAATIKALSAAISVPPEEKRRIMGLLVLVVLIYTLLFLPSIIRYLVQNSRCPDFVNLSFILLRLSPLADLFMYVFLRKGAVNKLLDSVCCRKNSTDSSRSTVNDGNTVSSILS